MNSGELNLGFICVGPQRTATSWLNRALSSHREVGLPSGVKETFFFDRYFDKGVRWYAGHFIGREEIKIVGEVAPTYFDSYPARERVARMVSDVKIIISVRNPVARTYSLLVHEYAKGRLGLAFEKELGRHERIISSGRYSVHQPLWESIFPKEQIHYIVQDDIVTNPECVFFNVCEFLGVEAIALPEDLRGRYGSRMVPRFQNVARVTSWTAERLRRLGLHPILNAGKRVGLKAIYKGGDPEKVAMTPTLFDRLLDEHRDDIRFLEDRLGRDFSHWRDYSATMEEIGARR